MIVIKFFFLVVPFEYVFCFLCLKFVICIVKIPAHILICMRFPIFNICNIAEGIGYFSPTFILVDILESK